MSSKKASIAKITSTDEACQIIQEWFQRENRPATAQSLTDTLGSRIRKPLVQRILDDLLGRQVLQCKDLKKIRFFFLSAPSLETATEEVAAVAEPAGMCPDAPGDEDNTEATNDEPLTLHESQQQHRDELIDQIMAMRSQNEARETELTQLASIPTSDERRAKLDVLTTELDALYAALHRIQSARQTGNGPDSSATLDVHALVTHYQRSRHLWKERKEYTLRLVEGVLGDTCTLSELSALFGITTDEEAGVSFRSSALAMPHMVHSNTAHAPHHTEEGATHS